MLHVLERRIYWAIWLGTAFYILYRFSLESRRRLYLLDQSDFADGWKFLNRPQDTSDEEWRILKSACKNYWIWFVGHALLSISRCRLSTINRDLMSFIYVFYSLLFVIYNFGTTVALLYMVVAGMCILLCYINSRILSYISMFFLLYMVHVTSLGFLKSFLQLQGNDVILIELGYSWLVVRVLAVAIDVINGGGTMHIPSILMYCFYLPVFYTGPITTYDDFKNQFYSDQISHTKDFILKWILGVCKYVLYYFTLEFLLHFLYSTSVQFYPDLAEQMDGWTLCGLGYSLSVIFYLKYVIIYGVGGIFAKLDNLDFPPPPKCVSRISLNSSMWKHFDRGLYLWITRYLYMPLTGPSRPLHRRLFASFCCFLFMTLWHGLQKSVFLWCLLNFLAVSAEMSVSRFYTKFLHDWRVRNVSENNFVRIKAALGAFTFLHLCLSCMFFLSSWEVGLVFYRRIFFTVPVPLLPTLFIMYSESHVALEVEEWESKKKKKEM